MKELPVTFHSDGEQIVGMLHLPDGANAKSKCPAVVFLHGFTGSRHEAHRLFVLTARALARDGIASLRFDFRGSGDSAGDFSEMTVSRELQDAREATRFLRAQPGVDTNRVGILGMSMGGLVAALLMGEDPDVRAAVLWCPVGDFHRLIVSKMTPEAETSLKESGVADYGGWPVGNAFVQDGLTHRPAEALARSNASVLILHGDADQAVPAEESMAYKNATRREIVTGADHTYNSLPWVEQVVTSSARWFREHV